MKTSYRLGNLIVVGTVIVSLFVCLTLVGQEPPQGRERAGQNLGNESFPLGAFSLVERSGRTVTEADFADRVIVVSFVFTRCPLSCPRISSVMKGLQGRFKETGVRLVSISVDPEYDTRLVLKDYARRFDADPDRWWFLTGLRADVFDLITQRFKLGLVGNGAADQETGVEAFTHSDRLVLVDHGRIAGYFDSNDPEAITTLVAEAQRRDGSGSPLWVRGLPALNATLNGSCAILLALGWILIRTGNLRAHAATMISCVVVSALFLTSYLVYHYQVGSVPFRGVGTTRLIYFTILLSHTVLATFGVVPLVALTLTRALQRRFDRHSRVAGVTFPIWMYVSITGVIIYFMLYQLPVSSSIPFHPHATDLPQSPALDQP